MTEPAYYLSWSSRHREPVRAAARLQDAANEWTTLLELEVDEMGAGHDELLTAILEHRLGRPAIADELELARGPALRITVAELDQALARGTQRSLFE